MAERSGDIRLHLQHAALELFRERGYERTTTAEIAARVGVTERTFFRYFPDKREVLFEGEAVLRTALTAAIADAPPELGAADTLFRAFRSMQSALEANRPFSVPRQEVISATPALLEREMAKTAALADALALALRDRGVDDPQATLAARAGMVVFVHATLAWLDDPSVGLGERLDQDRAALTAALTSDG